MGKISIGKLSQILQPIVMSTIGQTTYADMKQMETLLMNSELDWTVVRPSGLFETLAVTDYEVAEDHIRGQFTSRADLADCMLKQLTTDQYSRKHAAVRSFDISQRCVHKRPYRLRAYERLCVHLTSP